MYDIIKEAYRLGYAIAHIPGVNNKFLTDLHYNTFMFVPPMKEFMTSISDEELMKMDGLCPSFSGKRFTPQKLRELGEMEQVIIDPGFRSGKIKIPAEIDNEYCRFRYVVIRSILKVELIKVLNNNTDIVRVEQVFRLCKKVDREQIKYYQLWNDVDIMREVEYRSANIQMKCLQTLANSESGADARFVYMALASESEKRSLASKGNEEGVELPGGNVNNTQEVFRDDDLKQLHDKLNGMFCDNG